MRAFDFLKSSWMGGSVLPAAWPKVVLIKLITLIPAVHRRASRRIRSGRGKLADPRCQSIPRAPRHDPYPWCRRSSRDTRDRMIPWRLYPSVRRTAPKDITTQKAQLLHEFSINKQTTEKPKYVVAWFILSPVSVTSSRRFRQK